MRFGQTGSKVLVEIVSENPKTLILAIYDGDKISKWDETRWKISDNGEKVNQKLTSVQSHE